MNYEQFFIQLLDLTIPNLNVLFPYFGGSVELFSVLKYCDFLR